MQRGRLACIGKSFYGKYLYTISFGEQFRKASFNRLLMNAEEKSVF